MWQIHVCIATETADANESSKYLDAVREFADNVLKHGRDTYGPKHTPLFVDGLNIHTHEPVKWIAPNGDRWILSNLASQQNLFRTLDGLTKITGDPKYRQAAVEAIKYAFENLRSPNGLLYWGGHAAYDAGADKTCGRDVHELKEFYPYYELMWEVNPQATKQFIEAFWSGHVLDWSNLDFDRHCYGMDQVLAKPWDYEYMGGPVFFKGKGGLSFGNTGSDLCYAAALLTKLSGDTKSLIWSKRLAHRYVEARNPQTGINPGVFSGEITPGTFVFPHCGFVNSTIWPNARYYYMRTPGTVISHVTSRYLCQLVLGEILGDEGRDFTRYAREELTAIGKTCYRRQDNVYIPTSRSGASLEGYLCASDDPFGPKGSKLLATPAQPSDFWAYAVAYRLTDDPFMWEMARDIARGNRYGDIGISPTEEPQLDYDSTVSDPHGLLGFLELYRKTKRQAFLRMAERIAGTMLADRFHEGFFVGSAQLVFCKFDAVDSLALLHLHAFASGQVRTPIPHVWPGTSFFDMAYRNKEEVIDNLIYAQNRSPLPMSLHEAAATGDIDLVRSLIEKGIDIDGREDTFLKTALHHAVLNGHKNVVACLLDIGADVDAKDSWPATPLQYAAEKGFKEIAKLLIDHGADLNAARGYPAGDRSLHSAIRAGHKDIVELLIVKGADINAKNDSGQTPVDIALSQNRKNIEELLRSKGGIISSIHVAAQTGDVAGAKTLIEQGADVNAQDDKGLTPLHYAVQGGHKELVELLIANGADINGKDKGGYTSLYYAVWYENKDIVKLLITKGADVNLKPEKDYPPLHYAVWNEDLDMVKLLVAQGAKFDVKDQDAWTAFRYAAAQGNRDVVEFFITKGADVSSIHVAACMGDLARVKRFVEEGADVDTKDELGWTPLYWAASTDQDNVAEFLIANGADVNAKTNYNSTPLYQAAATGGLNFVKLLISKGADVNAEDKHGNTPLHSAASSGQKEVVELLISKGAIVDAKGRNGRTPLYNAALRGHKDIVEILVAKGADIDAKDKSNQTALYMAVMRGRNDVAELLIAKGADVNSRNANGQTPLHLSASQGRRDMVELLIAKGADVNARNKWNRTPLDIAVDRGHTEIVELLRKRKAEKLSKGKARKTGRFSDVADLIFTGETGGRQQFGNFLFKGDVNGDGYNDLLITASNYESRRGRAYLYYGGPDMDADADKIFTGENIDDLFGEGAFLSDLNNDGFSDVIVGALGHNDRTGRVYVYYGGQDMDVNPDLIINGEATQSNFGQRITTGDVNCDGHDDLFVAAPKYDSYRGRVYLYYVGNSFDTIADKIFEGETSNDTFGFELSARGDIDGDGCKDLLVGTPWWPQYTTNRGRAYLYYGATGIEMDIVPDVIFTGENNRDNFGHSLDLFDIDNDGYSDVLIGSRKWPAGGLQGRVYLYWGSNRATFDNVADVIFNGEKTAKASFGGNTIHAAYVNDDKYGDFIIGAYDYFRTSGEGRAYLFYGGTKTSIDVEYDHAFDEDVEPRTWFGKEGILCDLNNDGFAEAVIGAPAYNNLQGRVYVYFNRPLPSKSVSQAVTRGDFE
jgi:ankyrin repeat protein